MHSLRLRPQTAEVDLALTVASLAHSGKHQETLSGLGLAAQSVSWDDVGRDKNSCVGPNISDLTLCAGERNMPIIRPPNFSDVTVDVPMDSLFVTVGNEAGLETLQRITLREYLENITKYAKNEAIGPLLCPRDKDVLVAAQACVLPLKDGSVPYHVSLYNYQSEQSDPAVLAIVASAQGTSCQVIERGVTALYFNDNGTAKEWVAKRLSDDRAERGLSGAAAQGGMTRDEQDRNLLYIIQVPLEVKPRAKRSYKAFCFANSTLELCAAPAPVGDRSNARGLEDAVVSKGTESMGRYEGTRGLTLKRDARFPIRVTVQLYKVTDTADIPAAAFEEIAVKIQTIYSRGAHQGSLVTAGATGRVTEHSAPAAATLPVKQTTPLDAPVSGPALAFF